MVSKKWAKKIKFRRPHLFIGIIFILYHIATASSIITNIFRTNGSDEEVEVTDDDGEEEFDGDAFSVLLATGKVDYLGKGTAFKYQRSSQQSS